MQTKPNLDTLTTEDIQHLERLLAKAHRSVAAAGAQHRPDIYCAVTLRQHSVGIRPSKYATFKAEFNRATFEESSVAELLSAISKSSAEDCRQRRITLLRSELASLEKEAA